MSYVTHPVHPVPLTKCTVGAIYIHYDTLYDTPMAQTSTALVIGGLIRDSCQAFLGPSDLAHFQ
jgi:hypothetical protein